jgi:hypothetical protein
MTQAVTRYEAGLMRAKMQRQQATHPPLQILWRKQSLVSTSQNMFASLLLSGHVRTKDQQTLIFHFKKSAQFDDILRFRHAGASGLCQSSGILNTTFRKLHLFPSSGERIDTYSAGSLRKS